MNVLKDIPFLNFVQTIHLLPSKIPDVYPACALLVTSPPSDRLKSLIRRGAFPLSSEWGLSPPCDSELYGRRRHHHRPAHPVWSSPSTLLLLRHRCTPIVVPRSRPDGPASAARWLLSRSPASWCSDGRSCFCLSRNEKWWPVLQQRRKPSDGSWNSSSGRWECLCRRATRCRCAPCPTWWPRTRWRGKASTCVSSTSTNS